MEIAGRILIIPRGTYDAETTYEILDLVSYNGTSWLAKKTFVGIEPNSTNNEYWHKMFDFVIVNNLDEEREGCALDARQGKILKDRFQTITGTLPANTGYGTENEYPDGFSVDNCVIVSAMYKADTQWKPIPVKGIMDTEDSGANPTRCFPVLGNKVSVYAEISKDYDASEIQGAQYKIVLMRTDI